MSSCQYTILRPSCHHNGISYTGKTPSLYCIHYLNQCWVIVSWAPRNKLQRKFYQTTNHFIQENACHPDDLRYYAISFGRHNVIWTLSHPGEVASDRISSRWLMADALCHPDDLANVISSGWVTANSLCHPDNIPFHLMSCIDLTEVGISSGWVTAMLLCHPDDIRFLS